MNIKNISEIPKIEKIVLNITNKNIAGHRKNIIPSLTCLMLISGKKLKFTVARKSIAFFKLRSNQIIGCKVNLRRKHMYTFLEKLITIVLPRVRNLNKIILNIAHNKGSISIGVPEIFSFCELENYFQYFQSPLGFNITLVTGLIKTRNAEHLKSQNINFSQSTLLSFISSVNMPCLTFQNENP